MRRFSDNTATFPRNPVIAVGVLAFCLFSSQGAQAAPILQFNFNDSNAVVDAIDGNLTSTNFLSGGGLTNVSFSGTASARGWNPSGSAATALTAGDYWTFTVTAQAGYQFDLTSVSLDDWRATNGPVKLQLWSGGWIGSEINVTTSSLNQVVGLVANDLTSLEIRLVAWNAANNGNAAQLFLDNVVLNGAVERIPAPVAPVPEPASMLLIGTGLAGLAAHRRRRARA